MRMYGLHIIPLTAFELLAGLVTSQETGNHPEWPRWCGKAYQPQYPAFDPGGEVVEPGAAPGGPLLNIQLQPRYSIYLESENQAEFIVNAGVSKWHGQPWPYLDSPATAPQIDFSISVASTSETLVSGRVLANTTGNLFAFDLSRLQPTLEPYEILFSGGGSGGAAAAAGGATENVTAKCELMFLPEKKHGGSVTKLDHLNGGFLFRSPATGGAFEPFLPFGYCASCDNFLCDGGYENKVRAYKDLGLNSMVSLTRVQDSRPTYEYLDELDMRYMYDLRGSYKNLTAVAEQVSVIRDFDGLYSYWGADEPDGHQDPFDLLPKARALIRKLDPYHPVSVTLNCQNFHFGEYTAGADFIMEDVYPIGINTSTLSKWGTPCNQTYGDCGCDNCQGNVQDVASRLDDLARYEEWLGVWPKTKAHNPQTFFGEGYWSRVPTDHEEVAMNALAFNHGAKLIASWVWPFSDGLGKVMGDFSLAVARSPVRDFLVSGRPARVNIAGHKLLDAAYWVRREAQGQFQLLVCVVNGGYEPISEDVSVFISENLRVEGIESVVWGNASWTPPALHDDDYVRGAVIKIHNQSAMSTNMATFRASSML